MTKLFATLSILVLISCKNQDEITLENVLKSNCVWDITGDNQVIGGLNACFRFLPNSECYFYYYNFSNRKITNTVYRYETDDVIVSKIWSTMGDTILIARGARYKVLASAKDSVVIEGYLNDTMVLLKNCRTIFRR